jgi:AGCS family alanine or glycine:cation symporter
MVGSPGSRIEPLSAELTVANGVVQENDVTVIHNRSIAEDVRYFVNGEPYTGTLQVVAGKLRTPGLVIRGRSLLHSVPLTAEAFKRSFLGDYGQYAVTIGLVLFAFSTALAWSYYGDRSMTYLIGVQAVMPYRMVYVVGFFLATVVDTSLIWLISAVTLALMAIPNLIGLMLMRKEVRQLTRDYWSKFQHRRNSV